MALITSIGCFVLSLLMAVLRKVFTDEILTWVQPVTRGAFKLAVSWLPEMHRARYTEEWQGHLDEIQGDPRKLVFAVGLLLASGRISRRVPYSHALDRWRKTLDQFDDARTKATMLANALERTEQVAGLSNPSPARIELISTLAECEKLRHQIEASPKDWGFHLRLYAFPGRMTDQMDYVTQKAEQISATCEAALKDWMHRSGL